MDRDAEVDEIVVVPLSRGQVQLMLRDAIVYDGTAAKCPACNREYSVNPITLQLAPGCLRTCIYARMRYALGGPDQ